MTDSTSTMIEVGKILVELQPAILTILSGIGGVVMPIIARVLYLKFNFELTEEQWKVVHSAAAVAAGQIWARAEPTIVSAKLDVRNPTIATAAHIAIEEIPVIAKKLGVTPETMATLIAARIGHMQALAPAAPVVLEPVKEAAA